MKQKQKRVVGCIFPMILFFMTRAVCSNVCMYLTTYHHQFSSDKQARFRLIPEFIHSYLPTLTIFLSIASRSSCSLP